MATTMKVSELLAQHVRPMATIDSEQTVAEAIDLMTQKKVSALIVIESEQAVGIFAERDVFRTHIRDKSAAFSEIRLKDAMTDKLFSAKPGDDVSRVMSVMIQADIKHMPVLEGNRIVGILTLNDIIEQQLGVLTEELQHLREYIDDLHDAGHD